MLSALSTRSARSLSTLSLHSRRLATQVPARTGAASATHGSASSSTVAENEGEGPLRPHLGIEVNPNHGLYAFFRRKEADGEVSYDTVESADVVADKSGRSWTAPELRRKSFQDLHTLWYVVLRERNLLATQQAEARRLGANEQTLGLWARSFRCRKTMARIKYVINERRLAFEGAMKIFNEEQKKILQAEDKTRAMKEAEAAQKVRKQVREKRRGRRASDAATQSLFETAPVELRV